jgi:hypothetical protein
LFDARFFKEHNIKFDERLPNHEDWDCWMNIFSLKPEVYYIDQQLAIYRIHTDSMVYNRKIMKTGFIKAIHSQRRRYNREDIEYKLLTKKIRLTKRSYGSNNKIVRSLSSIIYKIKKHIINA